MTTLAIIGSGIGGRSLIYTLAKEKKAFTEILLFGSESFAKACSYRSTAVVAPRGLTEGLSDLGNILIDGYKNFKEHFENDSPAGVERVLQLTGSRKKIEEFKTRYPDGKMNSTYFNEAIYTQEEEAYLIDPKTYLDFLLSEAKSFYGDKLKVIDDFVLEGHSNGRLRTHLGVEYNCDRVVHASGVYNRFWTGMYPNTKLKTIKSSQGAYFQFSNVDLGRESLSLTLDGHNYIWNKKTKNLLVGSTTLEAAHEFPPQSELNRILEFFRESLNLPVPTSSEGAVQVGLREKAQKRSPYFFSEGKVAFMGGFYKNGYTLGLTISKNLSRHFL